MADRSIVSQPDRAQQSRELERDYFDSLVTAAGDFNPFTDAGWRLLRRRFEELVAIRSVSMLDIGCGTGQSRQIYTNVLANYTGVDLSPVAIAAARTAFPSDDWLVADACQLPYPDEHFDLVAFSSVLHHIEEFPAAVKEAARVVKPGGTVFAYDPNVWHPAFALLRHPRSPLYFPQGVSPQERPLAPRRLADAFRAAGLIDIRQRCLSGIGYRHVAPRALHSFVSAFNLFDGAWELSGLGRWFGSFVLTAGTRPVPTTGDRS
ncbi:class I SAM-dependent methyltransferase [Planctomicrobium piriforme]|uniref:Ubiquinone/menaquinone biosynthesis C-methylase UbiE n=1 Tax=Planctomicrobium piriforme TaxID=1576369 RepID=A0A1I3H023_9PLAN|nr:class I SAM-dependent methyltransferase [Planctomicrobium piriforme]SFI28991.1 Ubiquinone/menaquinone biosynthesis C-methylase UbiE [Planctomicrobium piriforme]